MKRAWLFLLPASLLAAPAPPAAPTAPADPLDALAADSPFLPGSGARAPVAAGATGPLELRSVVFVDGVYRFSIFDQGTGTANWVTIGEREQPYVARSFDRERDSLTVEHQGRTVVLSLQPARMASSGSAIQAPPTPLPGAGQSPGDPTNPTNRRNTQGPVPVPGSPSGPGPGSGAAAPSAAESQRLQNLADEIRRRRGTGARINFPQAQPQPKRP